MYGANEDHAHCVSELLENGASINYTNEEGVSAYKLAIAKGNKKGNLFFFNSHFSVTLLFDFSANSHGTFPTSYFGAILNNCHLQSIEFGNFVCISVVIRVTKRDITKL